MVGFDGVSGHKPLRMCIVCRKRFYKKELNRFVFDTSGKLVEDITKCLPGRGYYVCADKDCVNRFAKRAHARSKGVRAHE